MRVAIMGSRGYPSTYGGFETFVRELAPYLAEAGHEVVVYGREQGRLHRREQSGAIGTIRSLGYDAKAFSTLSYGLTSAIDASFRRFDVALVVNVANGYFLPFLRLARVPVLLNVDGIEWDRGKWGSTARRIFRTGARMSARFADSLVADSQEIAEIWSQDFGVTPSFIPYGAHVVEARGAHRVEQLGLSPRSYALVVARLAPENNVDLFLDALALMDPRPQTVVVGSANYDMPVVQRLRALSNEQHVTWLGHVADQELLLDLWAHAGVYVHGHSVGGTNPALLQALGAGAPTLAYPSAFNREVVASDSLLYPPHPQGLADAMAHILDSHARQSELRAHGMREVRARYAWPDVCQRYALELDRLAACNG
jgi:glycosyltransferase involved in cell wall biosynthesis